MSIPTEEFIIPGLPAEAEIVIDRWGIPHIRSSTEAGAFFAQGFNAARDRLWLMDTWRKRGLGLLAGVLGPDYVERDEAARLLLYRGDMAAEWAEYGPDAQAWTTAFAAGINAYVDLVAREPARLPLEFRLLGTRPAHWSPEDVVRCRTHARVRNLDAEVTRNNIAARSGSAISASFSPWVSFALMAYSSRAAALLSPQRHSAAIASGGWARVYLAPRPLTWSAHRRGRSLVSPVYRLPSRHRRIYT